MRLTPPENRDIFTTGTHISDSKAWMFSLIRQLQESFKEWKSPSPRTGITASPVEVRELWTKKRSPVPGLLSLLAHAAVLTIAITSSLVSHIKPKPASGVSPLLSTFALSLPASAIRSGGGGGMRALTPASRGVLPRAAEFQLVPPSPIVTNMSPQLIAEPTIIDIDLPNVTNQNLVLQLGDPNGVVGPPSGGPGSNNGMGGGTNGGIGDGNGPFPPGLGNGPRRPGGAIAIGTGGASPPSCPLPATEPNYTDAARKAHIQGTVILEVIVNKDGSITVSDIVKKLGYGLDDEASRFVTKSMRCSPGVYLGQPVATPVRIDVNFHLY